VEVMEKGGMTVKRGNLNDRFKGPADSKIRLWWISSLHVTEAKRY
jgi:hypothetical protein